MRDVKLSAAAVVQYIVEVDGVKYSEHAPFVDAVKSGYSFAKRSLLRRSKCPMFRKPRKYRLKLLLPGAYSPLFLCRGVTPHEPKALVDYAC
jgi:hypothetical protein